MCAGGPDCLWHMDTDIVMFDMAKTPHPEELSFLPGASHPLLDREPLKALVPARERFLY